MTGSSYTVHERGAPAKDAAAAVVLFHGRGASAESMLSLADDLQQPECAFLAIQAPGYSWYPNSFLAPIETNEPFLSRALEATTSLIERLSGEGILHDKIVLIGFSQGACLALEFAARNAGRYGGVVAFSGGLIGRGPADPGRPGSTSSPVKLAGPVRPDGPSNPGNPTQPGSLSSPSDKRFDYPGRVQGTPVFLGCSDIDPHIPAERVHISADVFGRLGADVDKRIYPGMGHTINQEEMDVARRLIERVRMGA